MVEGHENPHQPPNNFSQATDLRDRRANERCPRWGIASLACAMVFPVAFYGIVSAETARILSPAPPWGRAAVGAALTVSSLLAVTLGILSLARETPSRLAIIGIVVGGFELLLIVAA